MKTLYKKLFLLLLISVTTIYSEQASLPKQACLPEQACQLEQAVPAKQKKHGLLHEIYLAKGEYDAPVVCKSIFPNMTVLEINDGIRDIIIFIQNYVKAATRHGVEKTGEFYLTNILHTYGHIFTFIKNARVDLETKKVFVVKNQEWVPNAVPIDEYWLFLEQENGLKLNIYKFYATCLDYLAIMLRSYLLFPCRDRTQLKEVEDRWIWWMEKVERRLNGHPLFGGYYNENVKIFREVFQIWKDDFEKTKELKRKIKRNMKKRKSYEDG